MSEKMQLTAEATAFIRDLKLNSVLNSDSVRLNPPRSGMFPSLSRGRRMLDQLRALGGVVTGSRALAMYTVCGRPVLGRRPNDWDVLLDTDSFWRFCADNNLTGIKFGNDRMRINLTTGIHLGSDGYGGGERYLFRYDLDVVARDALPAHSECGGWRVASLESILAEKLRLYQGLADGYYKDHEAEKHGRDLVGVMTKFRAYLKPQTT
jgi:hypothetical protein